MSTLAYPARFDAEPEGGYSVWFPDFPEGHSQGDTKEEAFEMAMDCLHAVIEWRLEERSEIPRPSPVRRGQFSIPVSLDLAPKVALYQVMRDSKMSNLKLAGKIKVSELVVRRMLDPKHRSRPEQYIRALAALGCTPQVAIVRWDKVKA